MSSPMLSAATKPDFAGSVSGYMPIKVELLRHIRVTAVDIFIRSDKHRLHALYCRAGFPLEDDKLSALTEGGVTTVFVRTVDIHSFAAHLHESINSASDEDSVPRSERFAAKQLAVAAEIEDTLRLTDCGKFVTIAEEVGHDLTDLIANKGVRARDLFDIARHDFNTFSHITNIAGYSLVLAEQMGISDRKDLEQIATGAMLHDIGKRLISPTILKKPAQLDSVQRAMIQTHPQRGFEMLYRRPRITVGQLMMVYQHHERIDGSGYPVAILGNEIHPWARIMAVLEVFDALTSTRPHRQAYSVEEALEYIGQNAGTLFDPEVVECWTSAMNRA